ncbi:unnamed protein product [Brugia timori]|uniref:Sulfate_transp domain-containing protein n=1 Tax=Brugia timori TaxID=42155 RepID=A0A0R3QUM3_9BILA|nr:unnamed protein product [Brugia timori]
MQHHTVFHYSVNKIPINKIYDLLEHSSEIHLPTIAFSISAIIFLFFGKEILAPRLSDVFLFLLSYELMLAIIAIIATNFAEI